MTSLIGREVEILVERGNRGHLADFTPALFDGKNLEEFTSGQFVKALATGHNGNALVLDSREIIATPKVA